MQGFETPNFVATFCPHPHFGHAAFIDRGNDVIRQDRVVLFIVRNALSIQQAPPNILIYGIALVLTGYIMAPALTQVYTAVSDPRANYQTFDGWQRVAKAGAEPIRQFMTKNTTERDRVFFVQTADKIWRDSAVPLPQPTDFAILVPAFLSSELTKAFEIGFLLYLPFVMIDFAVSAILSRLACR